MDNSKKQLVQIIEPSNNNDTYSDNKSIPIQLEDLILEARTGSFYSPYVSFSATTGVLEIGGESHLEDGFGFYRELCNWIENYLKNTTNEYITFKMKITFFNTDSSKGILSLLKTIKKNVGNKQLQFFWYYPSDNYDLRAEAEDFMGDVDMHFTLVPYDFE